MSSAGKIYYERGIRYFELEQYEQAVTDFIQAYESGYEKEQIMNHLYQCFIYPNEQEFRNNYSKNSAEFTQLDYDSCTLDFIPVSDERFFIFDREKQEFQGMFVLDEKPVQGRKIEFNSILYTDLWDIREIIPDMKDYSRNTIYILLNDLEPKFVSFFKLPNFKELYCSNLIVFKNDNYLRSFFEEYEEFYLPKVVHSAYTSKYADLMNIIHQKRNSLDKKEKQERKNIFLSVCLPSYNCGTGALKNAVAILNSPYDSEIEIVISNNASIKDTMGYLEIQKIKDTRIQYYEFSKHEEKNINVLKTLELSHGMFAVLVADNNLINIEQLAVYFNYIKSYAYCGVLVAKSSYTEMKNVYKAGLSAVDMASNLNDMDGMAFNMQICADRHIFDILKKNHKNAFIKDYIHTCAAMLLCRLSDMVISDLDIFCYQTYDNEGFKENQLSCMQPERRIAQQTGFLELVDAYFNLDTNVFISMFLKKSDQTYFLIRVAYDSIDGFEQFGERSEVYRQIYKEQERYLKKFPRELSSLEYKRIKNRLQKIANDELRKGDRWLERVTINDLKLQIKKAAQNQVDEEKLEVLIQRYEKEYPVDLDLYAIKAWFYLVMGNNEKAYITIKEELRRNPFNFVGNQLARIICKKTTRFAEAVRYDIILKLLKQFFPELPDVDECKDDFMKQINELKDRYQRSGNYDHFLQCEKDLEYIEKHLIRGFGFNDHAFYESGTNMITVGTMYEDVFGNKKYNASYDIVDIGDVLYLDMKAPLRNWLFTKLECIEASKTNQIQLGNEGEYLLPVLQKDNSKSYTFKIPDGREFVCRNLKAQHFEYYRLPGSTNLVSQEPLYVGNPILLKQDPHKKKLILNIFVDGISQKVIEEENFAELMPFTSAFFSKGVHCSNVYTAAEWTLPSLASYVSGMSSVNHMIIHDNMTNVFSSDYTILAEYFKEQGYHTAKIDGDWRSTQSYGYGRGMDRIIYQHQYVGMNAEQVVQDVLEHMKLMKETNQFIWMCAGDLHMIADEFPLKQSVQASIPIEYRVVDKSGVSSVKQEYSKSKRELYKRQMKYIDEYLEVLYRYIEENYRDDEIIVSLFGDHGQGFLIEEGKHFLSEGRTKVAMMFRGGEEKNGTCDELLSTCDYLPIMCKLAGIPLKDQKIDGNLPVFFGGDKKRKYAITESIHPGDPYQASIVSEGYVFYFTSEGIVEYDGRFELGEYECWLYDQGGKECFEKERIDHYFQILLEHIGTLLIY